MSKDLVISNGGGRYVTPGTYPAKIIAGHSEISPEGYYITFCLRIKPSGAPFELDYRCENSPLKDSKLGKLVFAAVPEADEIYERTGDFEVNVQDLVNRLVSIQIKDGFKKTIGKISVFDKNLIKSESTVRKGGDDD